MIATEQCTLSDVPETQGEQTVNTCMRYMLYVMLLCPTPGVYAASPVIVTGEQKTIHADQAQLADARLIEVGFWSQDYHIPSVDKSGHDESVYGSKFYAWYQTRNVEDLESFVFVQFIQGCAYSTSVGAQGIEIRMDHARAHMGKLGKPYIHVEWEIDSTDEDPAYWSDADLSPSRHHLLRVGGSAKTFPDRLTSFPAYGTYQKPVPRLFVTDTPSAGSIRWNPYAHKVIASNSSMKFKMCLFRKEDVPTTADPRDVDFATPIVCYYWDNVHVYDHERKVMTSPQTLASACMRNPDAEG